MARPRFSSMLVNRRRQLGLSVKQASNVLKLREEALIAFEDGDFKAMPKSGYAQGMLASYARYLGLDPRELVNQYAADLREYEAAQEAQRRRGDRRTQEAQNTARIQGTAARRAAYQGRRGLLPTSGGYAGDLNSYSAVSSPRQRGRSTSLVDYREQERRYTGRNPSDTRRSQAGRRQAGRSISQGDEFGNAARYRGDEGVAERSGRDSVTTRAVPSSQYVDDLRYDDAHPYEAASTSTGRISSRNIASTERPNVRRRPSPGRRQPQGSRGGRGRASGRRGGIAGVLSDFFSDGRRVFVLALLVAALVITIVIITSVTSCVRNQTTTRERTVEVSSSSGTSDDGSSSEDQSSSDTSTSSAEAEAEALLAAQDGEEQEDEECVVTVSVENDEVSWIEIECDGVKVLAEQVTGPWSKTYDVTDYITIQVNEPTAVSVKKNGELQKFDSKTAGIGSLTIEGPGAAEESDSDASDSSEVDTQATGTSQ